MKTYECKIKDEKSISFIREMNSYFGTLLRKLYVKSYANPVQDKNQLKRDFCKEHGCSSTHYNSLKNHLDAVLRSRKELAEEQHKETLGRIKYTKEKIKKLAKKANDHKSSISRIKEYNKRMLSHKKRLSKRIKSKKPIKPNRVMDKVPIHEQTDLVQRLKFTIHQKKRRLYILEEKSRQQFERIKSGRWPLCFGTKKLQQKQNFLVENGYKNHNQWQEEWRFKRSNQSFWLGDSTEKGRNRNARLALDEQTLRLTVPQHLRHRFGAFVTIEGVDFDQRAKKDIEAALFPQNTQKPSPLTYRLLEREKTVHEKNGSGHKKRDLYLQVSVNPLEVPVQTRRDQGAVGVDLNHDHLAIGEVDRFGNPIQAFNLFCEMKGKSSEQISASFGDLIRDITLYAKLKNKPVVIEKLDFRQKKAALRETHGSRGAEILSSFAYNKFKQILDSRSAREGVELLKVNPAYSSILGAYNYFGLSHLYSSHQMAAFVLARRGLGFKDSLKCTYNERNHTALLRTVSIAADKAPPTFEAWIKSGGKRHRWSLLRRYYGTFSHFVKHLGKKPFSSGMGKTRETRRNIPPGPLQHLCSV